MQEKELSSLYRNRFPEAVRARKAAVWQVLCRDFFQHWIPSGATVLDIGCGYGEFINQIAAERRLAVDRNPDSGRSVEDDVIFFLADAKDMRPIPSGSVDVCFSSNFFEHLPNRETMDAVLLEAHRVLRAGGRYLLMQPNIRYCASRYWDFYDHILPLSHLSTAEALRKTGFAVERIIPRFVPFSTVGRLPTHPFLVRLYLRIPLVWPLLGKQFVIVARKVGPVTGAGPLQPAPGCDGRRPKGEPSATEGGVPLPTERHE